MARGQDPDLPARNPRGGFTLVELLVVIGIIALLVSILVPSLRIAVRLAREVHCAANVQTFAKAMTEYSSENRARFVSCMEWVRNTTVDGWDPAYSWKGAWPYSATDAVVRNGKLWKFIGVQSAYVCPTFKRLPWREENLYALSSIHGLQFTYSMNGHINHLWYQSEAHRKSSWYQMASDMRHPSKVFLLGEEMPWATPGHCSAALNDGVLRSESYTPGQDIADALAYLHGDGTPEDGFCNVVFADGHVGRAHIWETRDVTFDPP